MSRSVYAAFAYVGLLSVPATFIAGWRHDPMAPASNLGFNLLLFVLFIAVHFVMTLPAFKRAVYGSAEGSGTERRVYISVSILTWVGMYLVHRPVAGPALEAPGWLQFVGLCCVLLGVVAFFEFATLDGLGSLLGVSDDGISHSAGAETPLMTEGPYASVRHPMYRAATLYMVASLLIHPHSGQLLFALLGAAGFLAFIPVEERQLIRSRGDAYQSYMQATPYRVFRGIW
jgi:protein-S-isoprenylcysteine O-methyltransferase Ste14